MAKTANRALETDKSQFDKMIANAPHSPGVYRMYDAAENLLYVGKAKDLKKRLKQYVLTEKLEYHKIIMRRQVARVAWQTSHSESDALILEQRAIKTEKPKYNIVLKDDKMYPFLSLTRHAFPRLMKFRDKRQEAADKKDVYGPFAFVSDLNETIGLVQKVAQVRSCADSVFKAHKKRPCLLYQTGLCSAPCCLKTDYMGQVRVARQILRGRIRRVVSDLMKKMRAAAATQDYETAAKYRGQIEALQVTAKVAMISGMRDKK
jgi:excinuclease ABC subunit C